MANAKVAERSDEIESADGVWWLPTTARAIRKKDLRHGAKRLLTLLRRPYPDQIPGRTSDVLTIEHAAKLLGKRAKATQSYVHELHDHRLLLGKAGCLPAMLPRIYELVKVPQSLVLDHENVKDAAFRVAEAVFALAPWDGVSLEHRAELTSGEIADFLAVDRQAVDPQLAALVGARVFDRPAKGLIVVRLTPDKVERRGFVRARIATETQAACRAQILPSFSPEAAALTPVASPDHVEPLRAPPAQQAVSGAPAVAASSPVPHASPQDHRRQPTLHLRPAQTTGTSDTQESAVADDRSKNIDERGRAFSELFTLWPRAPRTRAKRAIAVERFGHVIDVIGLTPDDVLARTRRWLAAETSDLSEGGDGRLYIPALENLLLWDHAHLTDDTLRARENRQRAVLEERQGRRGGFVPFDADASDQELARRRARDVPANTLPLPASNASPDELDARAFLGAMPEPQKRDVWATARAEHARSGSTRPLHFVVLDVVADLMADADQAAEAV